MKNFLSAIIMIGLLSGCKSVDHKDQLVNEQAGLPGSFHFDRLGLKVLASFVNSKTGTMAVLYANNIVLNGHSAKKHAKAAGDLFALVTWKKQADRHWFGANIPGALLSVELIMISDGGAGMLYNYQKYTGKDLSVARDTLGQQSRIKYIFDLHPSIMP